MPSRWPILEEFFAPVLDDCERVLRQQRAIRPGQDGSTIESRGAEHHFAKADSHMVRMGPSFDGWDDDDQVPHVALVILRMLMVARCVSGQKSSERKR